MRTAVLGFLVVAGLVIAATGAPLDRNDGPDRRATIPQSAAAANNDLVVVSTTIGDRTQVVTVIEPKQRVMSVYHIDLATGKIALRSVRNIHWDLQVTEFNGESPLPREIQALLESK
ncbi:MAG: hypothetical protein NUV77_21550 [Thermoguttaceae bacterium]|jgi:hypothetical protein|nr:hypothetical protein [Thermoguttaceae bacterium]